VNKVKGAEPDHFVSDCPMAGDQIAHGMKDGTVAQHPMTLLRIAYGL
jgi:hypothetical protein